MSKRRVAGIAALMLVLIALTIIFWGSIASVLFIFLLIIIPCELLIQRFIIDREDSDFDDAN